jgi:CHAD domain-containing protein
MDERPAFQSEQAAGEALRNHARGILADARAAIEDPDRTAAVAVHDFRRAMKRWRALLRLLEPAVGREARGLREEARDRARALAGARDAQAALDALADLERHGLALSARSLAGMRRRLTEIRRGAENSLDAGVRLQLADALERAGALLERSPIETLTFDALATALARSYRGARRRVPADWPAASAQQLHELRKLVVVHRYQMDLIAPLWPRFVRMWTGETQRLRERLGKHHDASMLESLTRPHQPLARWRSQLTPAIAERKARHVAAAARIAARLFVEKPNAVRRRLAGLHQPSDAGSGGTGSTAATRDDLSDPTEP